MKSQPNNEYQPHSSSIYNGRLKDMLNHFILAIPVLFIKQFPYAWIAAVVFWSWPPTFSAVFLSVILIGLLILRWQSSAWISNLQREHAFNDGKFYVDQPPFPWMDAARRILILVAGAGLLAWLFRGQIGLDFWQIFLIIVGFTLLYRDTQFFGSAATYIVTASGIGIRLVPGHIDYRLFFPFKEISLIKRADYKQSQDIDLFARSREAKDGLLLIPKDPKGFTRRIDKLFIVPQDVEKFV